MTDDGTRALLRATLLAERQAAELRRRARGTQVRRLPLPRNGSERPADVTPGPVPPPAPGPGAGGALLG